MQSREKLIRCCTYLLDERSIACFACRWLMFHRINGGIEQHLAQFQYLCGYLLSCWILATLLHCFHNAFSQSLGNSIASSAPTSAEEVLNISATSALICESRFLSHSRYRPANQR